MISTSVSDVANWLLTHSLTALADCGRAPISTYYVGSGEVAWDDCCGSLVVTPERVFRSQAFPAEDTEEVICFDGLIAIEFTVLLLRCVPVVDDRGRAPQDSALATAHAELLGDAAVIYNALTGPFPDYWERTNPAQVFVGAQGGCIGVETRLIIGLEQSQFGICCAEPTPHEPGDPVCRFAASDVRFEPCEGLEATNVQDAICELAASGVPGPPGPPGPQGPPGPPGDECCGEVTEFQVNGGTIGGNQPTFSGPPLFSGHYLRQGDQVSFDIQVDFTNITSFGTGQYFVDLPFPARFATMLRGACIHDVSASREYGLGGHVLAGATQLVLTYVASNGRDEPFTHTAPFQLATEDRFHVAGTYIAEPLP